MNETDLKYLLASYQNTSSDLFAQSIATNAKIRQLNDLVEALREKISEQEKEINTFESKESKKTVRSKTNNNISNNTDDSTF